MEIVYDPSRSDYGEEMLTVIPFVDLAFASNYVDTVFHIFGTAGRQRMAGHERLASSSCQTRGKLR